MIQTHNSDIREALLSACSLEHLNFSVARKAVKDMVATKSAGDVGYVMLSNLFCATGQWNQAERVRIAMAEYGIKKSPGCSWIEVQGAVKVFVSGAQDLDHSGSVSDVISLLDGEMRNIMHFDV
jgi:hypothetical protein